MVSALECATMNGFEGGGGEGGKDTRGGGGPIGVGGGQGGRAMSWTCPVCRPGMARRIEFEPVDMTRSPARRTSLTSVKNAHEKCRVHVYTCAPSADVLRHKHQLGRVTYPEDYRTYPTRHTSLRRL